MTDIGGLLIKGAASSSVGRFCYYRQSFGLDAPVFLHDEPITDVDDTRVGIIRDFLLEVKRNGKLILVAEHQDDLERLDFDEVMSVFHLCPGYLVENAASAVMIHSCCNGEPS